LVIQHQAQVKLRDENAALRLQSEKVIELAAENERLNRLAQANSVQSLAQSQSSELLRLRGEVGSLRRQTNELAKVKAENEKARSLAGAPGGTSTLAPASIPLPKESWAFVGYANPESALQSAVWAMSQGDPKTFLASLLPEGDEFKKWQDKAEDDIAKRIKEEFEQVTA